MSRVRADSPESLTVTVGEAARMLGISRSQCYEYLKAKQLPGRQLGSRWVISRRRIEAFIDGFDNAEDIPPTKPYLVTVPH